MEKKPQYTVSLISKNVWATVFEFAELKETLRFRCISRTCLLGVAHLWRTRVTECALAIEFFTARLAEAADSEVGKAHHAVEVEETALRKRIRVLLLTANRGGMTFKSYKILSYLVNPAVHIVFPIYFVWLLLGNKEIKLADPGKPPLWLQIRGMLKDPGLNDRLLNIALPDISPRAVHRVELISGLYQHVLQHQYIGMLSRSCAYLFDWAQCVCQYKRVYERFRKGPIMEMKARLEKSQKMLVWLEKIFDRVMVQYSDEVYTEEEEEEVEEKQ